MNSQISWLRIVACALLVAAGLIIHFVTKLSELEQRGVPITARDYLTPHKWTTLSVVLGAYGMLLMSYLAGEMGYLGSFCMDIAANVAGDRMRARAQSKLEQPSKETP